MTDEFKKYAKQVVSNSKAFAQEFIDLGYKIISGGTDNHMFILDVYNSIRLTGREVEIALDEINITVNKNQIPNDTLPPLKSSGVRVGTAAMTTKGLKEDDFRKIAKIIDSYLKDIIDNNVNRDNYIKEVEFLLHR